MAKEVREKIALFVARFLSPSGRLSREKNKILYPQIYTSEYLVTQKGDRGVSDRCQYFWPSIYHLAA